VLFAEDSLQLPLLLQGCCVLVSQLSQLAYWFKLL